MSAMIPFESSGWPETAKILTDTGRPWPESAAVFDLRWHAQMGEKRPGTKRLAARWNWTEWSVRALLAKLRGEAA